MKEIRFPLLVSIFYGNHEANVTYIALFFDRTDRSIGIFAFQKAYLSWREVEVVIAMSTTNKNGLSVFFREEVENVHEQFPRVERQENTDD